MSEKAKVVLVGHCGPDSWALKNAVRRALPEAEVLMANSEDELDRFTTDAALLLINRVLDGEFDEEDGPALIKRVAATKEGPRTMLVSNFKDAQVAAVAAGAMPGFGKKEMGSESTVEKLRAALRDV